MEESKIANLIDRIEDVVSMRSLDSSWEEEFVQDMIDKHAAGETFTDNQIDKLEEILEKY